MNRVGGVNIRLGIPGIGIRPGCAATYILLLAALAPLYFIETPAMVDYVNHLARMELLTSGAEHPAYAVAWRFSSNSAMDLIVPVLGRLVGTDVAAKVFLAVSMVLIVTGAMALERAVKGRHEFAGLCVAAVLFSLPITWGLGNFTLGLGAALWGVALWTRQRPKGGIRLWLAHAAIVGALFAIHFFALGLYGLAVGLIELPAVIAGRTRPSTAAKIGAGMAAPVALLLMTMALTGGSVGTPEAPTWDFGLKGLWLLQFMSPYSAPVSLVTALAGCVALLWLAASRRVVLAPAGGFLAVGLLILYLALPVRLFGIAYVDVRLLTWAAMILPAFTTATPGPWRLGVGALLTCTALLCGGVMVSAWFIRQPDYAEIRKSFAFLKPGEAVLTALADNATRADQPLLYAPTLAVPEAGVFASSFYGAPTGLPIRVKPAFERLSVSRPIDYLPPMLSALKAGRGLPPQLQRWSEDFQYLYVIGPPSPAIVPHLSPVVVGKRFTLYRITG